MIFLNVRGFYLSNSKSTVDSKKLDSTFYNLTDPDKGAFLSKPKGFGLENSINAIEYNNMQLVTSTKSSFQQLEGELIFRRKNNKEVYLAYQNFLNFCADDELRFIYCLPNAKFNSTGGLDDDLTACVKVALSKIDKSEIDFKTGVLKCNVVFQVTSKWLKNRVTKSWKPWFNGKQLEMSIASAGSSLWSCSTYYKNNTSNSAKLNLEIDLSNTGLAFSSMNFVVKDVDSGTFYGSGGFVISDAAIVKLGIRQIAQKEQVYIDYNDQIDGSWMRSVDYSKAKSGIPFTFCSIPPNKNVKIYCEFKSSRDLSNQKVIATVGEEYASL